MGVDAAMAARADKAAAAHSAGPRLVQVTCEPAFDAFASGLRRRPGPGGRATRLVDDLETPVSAYLKIAHGRPYAFLFESVEGGAWRGRYSIIAHGARTWSGAAGATRPRSPRATTSPPAASRPTGDGALEVAARPGRRARGWTCRRGLPPMAAGVFGAIGYDMIRLVEQLPDVNPDPLDLPDAVMIRPSIVAIFDAIAQEIILVTTVRPVGRVGRGRLRRAPARGWTRSSTP